jgi:preprotein translocase subunit SecE
MSKIMGFINEVKAELKRVTWPTRDELMGATIIVCILVLVFAAILGSMDAIFSLVIRHIVS